MAYCRRLGSYSSVNSTEATGTLYLAEDADHERTSANLDGIIALHPAAVSRAP